MKIFLIKGKNNIIRILEFILPLRSIATGTTNVWKARTGLDRYEQTAADIQTTNAKLGLNLDSSIVEETTKQTAPTTSLELAQNAIEVTPGHSWLYYVGWTIVGIGLFSYGMKGLDYAITHYAFRGPLQPSHLSKLPIESTEPSTYFDVFYSAVLQPFDQVAGIILYGAAFVSAGFTLRALAPNETSEEIELLNKRILDSTFLERNILTLPSEQISATPQKELKLVMETETNVEVETPLLDEIIDLETLNELPPQLGVMDKLISTLTQDELVVIVTSSVFQAWQTQPEQFTYAMEKIITVTGPERMLLIMQIFGS